LYASIGAPAANLHDRKTDNARCHAENLMLIFDTSNRQGIDHKHESALKKRRGTTLGLGWRDRVRRRGADARWAAGRQGDAGGAQRQARGGAGRRAQDETLPVLFDLGLGQRVEVGEDLGPASMTFARRLAHVDNIPQQDSAERAFNKLTRTFTAQVSALKEYRSKGEQKMTVQHNHVAEGGQAIVGNVNAPAEGGGAREKTGVQPHALGYAPGLEMPREIEAERVAVPSAGCAGS
jgi:hypothetical protein